MRRIFRILKEALTGEEKNYTSGSIDRAIILLSIPMVLEMAGESIFAVVDAFFVSKIGPDAVATVGITETMLTLVYSLAIGVSAAATAMIARRVGEGDPQAASRAAAQTILLGTSISILLGIFGWIYAPEILRFMGGSEELIENGVGFTRIMFGTNIAIVLLFLLNAIFRGAGDASIAMQSLWIANAINIVLDPCLIFGLGPFPEMGVEGAAVATSIGRGAGVVFQLFILLNGRSILKIMRSYWRPRLDIIWRLIKVSAGGTGQFIIASASWIFLMRIVANFGSEVVAGYTIAIRLLILTILPSWGMSNAAATLVGQNLGAGEPARAERSAWRTAFFNMIFLSLVSVTYFAFAPQLIGIFTDEKNVLDAGVQSLRIISLGYIFFAYGMVLGQAFNGAGDTRTPTLLNFICFWLLEIPLAYALAVSLNWGPEGVFWAVAISESTLAILLILVFRRGRWKLVEI